MGTDTELVGALLAELSRLRHAVPEIRECLVASTDGLLIAGDGRAVTAEGLAALSAAGLGVSQRIADTAGHHQFEEVVIRSAGGYVAMYMVGSGAVLVILASAGANVGRLNHEARRIIPVICQLIEAATHSAKDGLPLFVDSSPQFAAGLPHRIGDEPR